MNGIDLNRFQFEYDLTWMAFFQDGFGITYTRYGGREDESAESHMTQKSLVKTMQKVLVLHESQAVQPESKYEPRPTNVSTPEDISTMRTMMSKRKESCIHCHDVKNARLKELQRSGRLEKKMVFTYPSPKNLGMVVDSDIQNEIKTILSKSAAEKAGLKPGDKIKSLGGHRVLTFADMTRVLELAPESGKLDLKFTRNETTETAVLGLEPDWKSTPNPSWRSSTNSVGPNSGFWAKKINDSQRSSLKLKQKEMGLQVVVVWGKWAKKAGIRNGDIVVSVDGKTDLETIRDLQTHLQMKREFGDIVKIKVFRKNKPLTLEMTLPSSASE